MVCNNFKKTKCFLTIFVDVLQVFCLFLIFYESSIDFLPILTSNNQKIFPAESPVAPNALGSLESLNMDSTMRHTFHPDYSVRACTEVLYLRVKRSLYLAAKRATLMERAKKDNNTDQFDAEVDKVSLTDGQEKQRNYECIFILLSGRGIKEDGLGNKLF